MDGGQVAEPSDAALLTLVRAGDPGALARLWQRHHDAASRFARQSGADEARAGDVVDEAFEAMVRAIRNGAGPDQNVRAYLLLAVRRLLARAARADARVIHLEESAALTSALAEDEPDPVLARLERETALAAFERLSERDRAVLHYLELEGMSPAEAAPLLGASPNAVSQANVRAKRSLRSTYLQVHADRAAGSPHAACLPYIANLGTHRVGRLGARDTARLEAHLAGCDRCSRIAGFVRDESRGMRLLVWPMLFGPGLAGYLASGDGGHAAGAGLAAGGAVALGAGGAVAATGGGSGAGSLAAAGAAGGAVGGAPGGTGGGLALLLRVARPRPGLALAGAGTAAVVAAVAVVALALSGGDGEPAAAPTTPPPPTTATSAPTVATTTPTTGAVPEPTAPTTPPPRPTTTTVPPRTGTPIPSTPAPPTTTPPPTVPLRLALGGMGAAVPGGPLTLHLSATNAGPTTHDGGTLVVTLPAGASVAAAGTASADAPGVQAAASPNGCTATGAELHCAFAPLAPGTTTTRTARVVLGPDDTATFTLSADGRGDGATLTVGATAVALQPVFADVLAGDVTVVGASLVSCDPSDPRCGAALSAPHVPEASTRVLDLVRVDQDEDPATTSSAGAALASAGTVRFAALVWGGDLAPAGGGAALRPDDAGVVRVRPPGAPARTVRAERVEHAGTRYQAYADVTTLVAGSHDGVWTVADVQAGLGPGATAGWALIVVTEDPTRPLRSVVVAAGLADVYPGRPATAAAYVPDPTGPATVWAVAYDGGPGDAEGTISVGSTVVARDPWPAGPPGRGLGFGFDVARLDAGGGPRPAPALTATTFDPTADRYLVGLVALVADTGTGP